MGNNYVPFNYMVGHLNLLLCYNITSQILCLITKHFLIYVSKALLYKNLVHQTLSMPIWYRGPVTLLYDCKPLEAIQNRAIHAVCPGNFYFAI